MSAALPYPHQPLAGQTALVTGGNSGIGAAIVRHMAAAGADVAINYIVDEVAAVALAEQVQSLGRKSVIIQADISSEPDVLRLFASAENQLGPLDILVNNAGIQRDAPLTDMTLAQWNQVIAVNLTGQFLCAREAVRSFRSRSTPPSSVSLGKIICMGSVHEIIPWAGHVNYAASKGGVALLMKSLAQELAPERIRVNGLCPGAIKTDINRPAWEPPQQAAKLLEMIPYPRLGEVDDIARAAVWLASDESEYITGHSLVIDGGMLLYPAFRTGG